MIEDIAETLIEEDKTEFESNLATTQSTEKLFKHYKNFEATAIPSSVSFKNEVINDLPRQSSPFLQNFASIFKISFSFVPNKMSRCYLYLQISTFPKKQFSGQNSCNCMQKLFKGSQ